MCQLENTPLDVITVRRNYCIFLNTVLTLTPNGQYLCCATFAFNERYVVSLNTVEHSSLNLSTELTPKKLCNSPNSVCKIFAINGNYSHVQYQTFSFKNRNLFPLM